MSKKTKKERVYKTLLSVLANGSELESRALLKKHSGEDAKNTQDLEVKLARLYALSPNKIDIEKEWAEIHPHKDFILKYNKPKELPTSVDAVPVEKIITDTTVLDAGYSNCSGNQNCNCNKTSNACGCSGFNGFSNASGSSEQSSTYQPNQNQSAVMVVGIVSVVAILGMVLFLHSKNK